MKKIAPPGHGCFSPHKKSPGVQYAQGRMRLRRPGATTSYGGMRGSTLLLHVREATHCNPAPKRRSPVADCRPRTFYRLAANLAGFSSFFSPEGNGFVFTHL